MFRTSVQVHYEHSRKEQSCSKRKVTCSWKPPSPSPRPCSGWSPPRSGRASCQGPAGKESYTNSTTRLTFYCIYVLLMLWWDRAGSLSAIYNIHLGRHPDIPKLFRPPLSQPLPHILCLLLTLHCHCIPKVLCVSLCAAKNASLHSCFFPNTHLLVTSTS